MHIFEIFIPKYALVSGIITFSLTLNKNKLLINVTFSLFLMLCSAGRGDSFFLFLFPVRVLYLVYAFLFFLMLPGSLDLLPTSLPTSVPLRSSSLSGWRPIAQKNQLLLCEQAHISSWFFWAARLVAYKNCHTSFPVWQSTPFINMNYVVII